MDYRNTCISYLPIVRVFSVAMIQHLRQDNLKILFISLMVIIALVLVQLMSLFSCIVNAFTGTLASNIIDTQILQLNLKYTNCYSTQIIAVI